MDLHLAALLARFRLVSRLFSAPGSDRARGLRALFSRIAHAILAALRRLVAPARCAACDALVVDPRTFCDACTITIERLSTLEHAAPPPSTSAPKSPPPALLVAYAAYGGALASAIKRFKYSDRADLAEPLGTLLVLAAHDVQLTADAVVPVPLHPRKLRARGYNQSALLAKSIAASLGAPFLPRALVRTRDTRPQASLDRADRSTNLAGAFRAPRAELVRGRHIVLVDDVVTTGATLHACREALLSAGAARVTALVLARRKAPDDP